MGFFNRRKARQERSSIGLVVGTEDSDSLCISGYTPLDRNPEIMTACRRISELLGSITIHLMNNTNSGDERIVNELSRIIDIAPMPNMTRSVWMQSIVMTMLLYGRGNAIVYPHTRNGYLEKLEPISHSRVSFRPIGYSDYKIMIDGKPHDPDDVLHFVFNPDPNYLWKGRGVNISLRDVANNLEQAAATKAGFMSSKWKPSIIVKVDAMSDAFSDPAKRDKILDEYIKTDGAGKPWIIPGEQIDVETIKPLTLSDLAISDSVDIDKRTVAAILGVPPFLLGIGEYDATAWNAFIQNTIRPMALSIAQEMSKKLIISPRWYLKFNTLSLLDWDLKTIADVYGALSDRGFVSGNEVRDRLGMSPADGLDEYRILENYIPYDMSGNQKKLIGGNNDE